MKHAQITAAQTPRITAAQVPSFYLPYAKQALAETMLDLDMAIASGCEFRAEFTAQFVIDRCEYVIGRMREAIEVAQDRRLAA